MVRNRGIFESKDGVAANQVCYYVYLILKRPRSQYSGRYDAYVTSLKLLNLCLETDSYRHNVERPSEAARRARCQRQIWYIAESFFPFDIP